MLDFLQIADPQNVAALVGVAVPLLVAFLTKKVASAGLRGVLNLLVSAVAGSTAYLVTESGSYDLQGFITATVNTFIVSIVSYYGLYKPTGVTDSVLEATAHFGLGRPQLQTEDATEAVEIPADEEMGMEGNALEDEAEVTVSRAPQRVVEVESLPVTIVVRPIAPVPGRRKRRRKTIKLKEKVTPEQPTVEEPGSIRLPTAPEQTQDVP